VQGAVGAQYAASKGIKSAYVLHDKTAYGQGIAEYFQREAKKLGIKVLGFAGTEEKANFDSILTPILASKPQAIYFGGMFDQSAVLFKQARQKGYKGMFLSDDGFDSSDATKIGGASLLEGGGTCFSTVSGPASVYPGTAKFIADFKAKFGSEPQPFRGPVLRLRGAGAEGHRERRRRRGEKVAPKVGRRGRGSRLKGF